MVNDLKLQGEYEKADELLKQFYEEGEAEKERIRRNNRCEYKRIYYLQNKEKLLAKKQKYCRENPEKIRKSRRDYYIRNNDKFKEYNKNYYDKNKEKIKEYQRKYYNKKKQNGR